MTSTTLEQNQKCVEHEKTASVLEKQMPQEGLEQMIRNIELVITGVDKQLTTTKEAKNQFISQLLQVIERTAPNDESKSNDTGVET